MKVDIIDDPAWQPDEEFKVQICQEDGTPLVGDDAECTVIIHDKD